MARERYKIKREYLERQSTFRAAPRPVTVIITIVLIAALVFVGYNAFNPVASFISQQLNRSSEPPVILDDPDPEPLPEPEPPPPPEPEPEPDLLPGRPEHIRAVMMPHETAVYRSAWDAFLADMPEGSNTVMVEAKDQDGNVLYNTANEDSLRWGAVSERAVDLLSLAEYLRENGFFLAVKLSSFNDPLAARADRRNNAIMHQGGVLWLDNALHLGGRPWLNPYSGQVRNYLRDLALEAAEMGAVYVLFDRFHFPVDPTGVAAYGETGGVTRHEILTSYARELDSSLAELGARFAIFLPVRTLDDIDPFQIQMTYGGNPAIITDEIVLSMNLNFLPGADDQPYLTLSDAITRAKAQLTSTGTRMLPALAAHELASREQQLLVLENLDFSEYILL